MLKACLYSSGDTIIDQGEHPDKVYFIESGEVEVIHRAGAHDDHGIVVGSMRHGCYFGEAGMLFKAAHPERVRCKSDCVLYSVLNPAFETLLADFPSIREHMICVAGKPAPLLRNNKRGRKASMADLSGARVAMASTLKLKSMLHTVRSPEMVKSEIRRVSLLNNSLEKAFSEGDNETKDDETKDNGSGQAESVDGDEEDDELSEMTVEAPKTADELKRTMALKMAVLAAFNHGTSVHIPPGAAARKKFAQQVGTLKAVNAFKSFNMQKKRT